MRRTLALVVLAIVVSMPGPAAGARRLACLRACGLAISACVSDGGRPRPCRRHVVRGCRRDGVAACAMPDPPAPPPTTTTTLVDDPLPPTTTLPDVDPTPGGTTTTLPPVVVTTTTTPVPVTTSTTLLPPPPPPPCGGDIHLIAEDGQYLGCVSCGEFHPDSIVNQFGDYGSEFSPTSIWNELGVYGSSTGPFSACNRFTRTPPRMEDEGGCGYGRLGLNEFVVDSVCGIHGDAELCDTLQAICAD